MAADSGGGVSLSSLLLGTARTGTAAFLRLGKASNKNRYVVVAT